MELSVKIHPNLLQEVIQDRQLVREKGYRTNRKIKFVSCFYILKSLTTTGVIQNYGSQINELCLYLNCTGPTFYKLIRNCEKLGYLRRAGRNLILNSYTGFAETFDLISETHVKIKYNCVEQKFHHLLESAYLQLREKERAKTFENKIKAMPELRADLEGVVFPDNKGNYGKTLQQVQIQAFVFGHNKLQSIFYLNPFTSCNSKTLRAMFNFKSEQSVAYLKNKLVKNKLAIVHSNKIYSRATQRVKKLYIEWNAKTKQTVWVMPDRLEYAPILQT